MITLVEGANRQKTPDGIALTILLAVLTIIFIPVVVSLEAFGIYSGAAVSVVILVALLVCLIPTTIGALLSAIGIAGMDRLVQKNVLAISGRAVEAAGDVQTLLLDKTGTITMGNRMASAFYPSATAATRPRRRGSAGVAGGRDAGGALHRGSWRRSASTSGSATSRPGTSSSPSLRRPACRASTSKGARSARARRTRSSSGSASRRRRARPTSTPSGARLSCRVHAAGGGRGSRHPRGHRAQGRGESPGSRRSSPSALHGHPDGDDHRRQPPDRGDHRPGSGRR